MKRNLFIITAFVIAMVSCKKDIQNLNEQTKKPTEVPPPSLFANSQKNLVDIMTSSSVNFNIFRLVTQQWTETTYTDESNYDLTTRGIPQSFWNTLYRDIIKNLQETKRTIPSQDPQLNSAALLKNQMAVTDIMQVYAYSILVNTFGNIPYTQALDINTLLPKYDDAKTVYYDLLNRLDTSLAALDPAAGSFGASDLLYGGDVSQWIVFGNSLKLRLGIIIADYDPAKAKTVIEAAAPKAMKSNADNAVFKYKEAPPNTNPIWVDLVQSGRHDFVAASTLIDTMMSLNDPRVPLYFSQDKTGGYSGGTPGDGNSFSQFSTASDKMLAPNFEALLMDYAEVELILSEAAARGFSVGGTAQSHYNAGITASITYWGGTPADAATYLSGASVNYATAPGDYKTKIGIQKWIAEYNRGFEAWTDIRRLDHPQLPAPIDAISDFPVRYTYPAQEQTLNNANYKSASTAIGGDAVTTKLFWDLY